MILLDFYVTNHFLYPGYWRRCVRLFAIFSRRSFLSLLCLLCFLKLLCFNVNSFSHLLGTLTARKSLPSLSPSPVRTRQPFVCAEGSSSPRIFYFLSRTCTWHWALATSRPNQGIGSMWWPLFFGFATNTLRTSKN